MTTGRAFSDRTVERISLDETPGGHRQASSDELHQSAPVLGGAVEVKRFVTNLTGSHTSLATTT